MNYKDYNDYELISYVHEDSEEASSILFEKYRPLIITIATKMITYSPNLGLEINDLIQEGMLGLNKAINTFDENEEASFYTYAKTCIERRMISLVVSAKRQKHRILNESVSLENYVDEEGINIVENLIADNSYNPENVMIEYEQEHNLTDKILELLTPFEQQVFEIKITGFKYKEIADILDKEPKAIDNALNRIKLKIKNIINR